MIPTAPDDQHFGEIPPVVFTVRVADLRGCFMPSCIHADDVIRRLTLSGAHPLSGEGEHAVYLFDDVLVAVPPRWGRPEEPKVGTFCDGSGLISISVSSKKKRKNRNF